MPTRIIGSGLGDSAKALTVDQFFQYLEELSDTPTKTKLYKTVAWAYRCIDLRANNLAAIPYKILRGETEIEDYPIEFGDMLWDLEADLCIFGAGYWLKDRPNVTKELQRLNPSSMKVLRDKMDPTKGIIGFEQSMGGGKVKRFKPEQIIYFRYYNPEDDLGPGVAPLQVAMEAAGLAYNANIWASQFFSHGAIPAVILETEQAVPDDELRRIRNAWERLTAGAKRAWRTIVLRRGLKAQVIQPPIKDLAMAPLFESIRTQIASAFGVPDTMIADAANYATAKEHRLSFYQDTIIPKARQIGHALNEQQLEAQGLEFEFQFDEIEAIQKDEAEKAEYITMMVDAKIITKDEAREVMGFEPMDASQEEELKPPMPEIPQNPQENPQTPPPQPNVNQRAIRRAIEDDLGKWEKKALSKGPSAPFESEFIPPSMMSLIQDTLASAETDEEVKAAFAAPFLEATWRQYP